ncbi:MAG: acetylxylan esterase [Candidatus Hydrogenedentes bacterium]|nr:acetylxylan esterase [Candidatus Hydrogenedentota bacterium]
MNNKVISVIVGLTIFTLTSSFAGEKHIRSMKLPPQLHSIQEITDWQNKVRNQLIQLMKLPSSQEAPADFAEKTLTITEKGKFTIKECEIQSTNNRRIKICLAYLNDAPMRKEKSPAVVCIHGHGGSRWSPFSDEEHFYHQFGIKIAEAGFVVISTDVGQHQVYEKERTLMGERTWDLMRCIDYLISLPWVDAEKIGCAGLSLGGEMAMWLSALDLRIKAVCVSGFLTYMDQMEQNHCMCWKFPGLRELVDFPDIYALIAPRAILFQNGEKEPPDQFPPSIAIKALEEIKPAYKIFNKENNLELVIHGGSHEIEIHSLLRFFKQYLHTGAQN